MVNSNETVPKTNYGEERITDNSQGNITLEKLIPFFAYIINCPEQANTKTEKIKMIVKAAAKFLNMKVLSWEKKFTMNMKKGH